MTTRCSAKACVYPVERDGLCLHHWRISNGIDGGLRMGSAFGNRVASSGSTSYEERHAADKYHNKWSSVIERLLPIIGGGELVLTVPDDEKPIKYRGNLRSILSTKKETRQYQWAMRAVDGEPQMFKIFCQGRFDDMRGDEPMKEHQRVNTSMPNVPPPVNHPAIIPQTEMKVGQPTGFMVKLREVEAAILAEITILQTDLDTIRTTMKVWAKYEGGQ